MATPGGGWLVGAVILVGAAGCGPAHEPPAAGAGSAVAAHPTAAFADPFEALLPPAPAPFDVVAGLTPAMTRVEIQTRLAAAQLDRLPGASTPLPLATGVSVSAWYRTSLVGMAARVGFGADQQLALIELAFTSDVVPLPALRRRWGASEDQVWESAASGWDAMLLPSRLEAFDSRLVLTPHEAR